MSILSINGDPMGITLFGDLKMRNISCEDADEGKSFPERGLGMGTRFIPCTVKTLSPKTLLR
jgi:hypothetical protein